LRLGNKGKDASQIMEGSDLALSCDVRSSKPEVRSFDWYWNDQLISKNQLGVVMNRGSLVLHRVEKSQSGFYYCAARNVHGVGRSRSLTIKISCKFHFNCFFTTLSTGHTNFKLNLLIYIHPLIRGVLEFVSKNNLSGELV
jgi:hypothetical protein